jgi:RNA:NAD 2''-phosphotransferase
MLFGDMTKDLSRTLSRVLRHSPEDIGIVLDDAGWTPVDKLLTALKKAGYKVDRDVLKHVVDTNDKKRFTISSDGRRIRAAQGHSVNVSLGLEPSDPPSLLFHGTASANLDSIFATGLNPGKRQQVHLSTNEDTAMKVGGRHGRAIVLKVDCAAMVRDGWKFYRADNGVWLTDGVPPGYLSF